MGDSSNIWTTIAEKRFIKKLGTHVLTRPGKPVDLLVKYLDNMTNRSWPPEMDLWEIRAYAQKRLTKLRRRF